MPIKLSAESFLAGVRQSGLVEPERLEVLLREFTKAEVNLEDSDSLADALVKAKAVTRWQVDKLLQGKFKGFILGRYRLQELLGRCEMSAIYLAEHCKLKRRCAIKVLPSHKVKDTSYLGRFQREAEAVASLDHPNIVRAYDVDMVVEAGTDIHFLVMEFVDGKDLEKLLDERHEFGVVEAVEYLRQAAEGLSNAHENGLIHRDVKPGNLLVDPKGTVKLLDLGLARFFKQTEMESLTIKHDEKVLGTADYLAPEQAVDSHSVDERGDVYSLGCTLYFSLCGHPPFTEGTLVQRLLAHQTKKPPLINKERPEVPMSLVVILDKMMEKRRENRYQKMRDVADALAQWLVENGGDEWKKAHPAVVAQFLGMGGFSSPESRLQEPLSLQNALLDDDVLQPAQPARPRRSRPLRQAQVDDSITQAAARVAETVAEGEAMREGRAVEREPRAERKPRGAPVEETLAETEQPLPVENEEDTMPSLARRIPSDHRLLLLAGLIMLAAVLVAGTGYMLHAFSK